jgi:integrase
MASLIKRSNGIYYFITQFNGVRRWISTGEKTREKALKRIPSLSFEHRHKNKIPNLSDYIELFLSIGCNSYREGTKEIYERALYSFLDCVGNKKLSLLSIKDIDNYRQAKLQIILPTTMNIYLRTLKSAFNKAVQWEILQRNPIRNIKLCPVPQQTPQFFNLDHFKKLLQTVKEPWLSNAIQLAVFTGMRRSEITNLQWKHIDFSRELIYVESDANFQTKTGKRRILPMNSYVLKLLQAMFLKRTGDYVIMLNGKKVRDIWLSRRFKQYIKIVNVDKSLHFHILRHTFASWLVQAGVPIYEVQALMGHSTIRVTRAYSHLIPKQLKTSVEMIVPINGFTDGQRLIENVEPLKAFA